MIGSTDPAVGKDEGEGEKMAKTLKPPYLLKEGARNNFQIWIVDGSYIRGHIDEEFTNFGQHYRFPYIPKNEFWIDKEAQHDEHRFFIEHLLVENRLMAQGMPYEQAIVKADLAERSERRRSGELRRVTHDGQGLPDPASVHERLWKKLENGISVWIVNGEKVRSVFDIDYTEGGHDYVYEFIPQNEVWIDDAIVPEERGYVLLHELHERNLMAKGWPYSKAHADSSRVEYRCRKHPDELHDALAAEGWA
jgi:hypothetical protein